MAFADQLRQASWRGVPFGLLDAAGMTGRRKVRHDYPYRDTVWLEDQGKLPREFRLRGFLVSDSWVYGGGDVLRQVAAMENASEVTGAGILVHPTRGRLTVDLIAPLTITERWDQGHYFEIEFSFVQGGTQIFPAIAGALGDLVAKAAGLADAAGLSGFTSAVLGPLENGVAAVTSLTASANEWATKIEGLARDATGLYGTLSQLGGADYGRYFNGRNSGFLAGLTSPYAGATSITDLIGLGASNRAAISSASGAVLAAIGGLGQGGGPAGVGSAVQASVAALQAAASDPADGVRMLSDLAGFLPASPAAKQAAGSAMSDIFQRSAAAAIARVSATYAPSSADDAARVRAAVLAPIDAALGLAGDTGADDVFQTFKTLRQSVIQDLGDRGGSLARLTTLVTPEALPAIVLAQRHYVDATRADELVTQADPVHPWFMPVSFQALAA